MNDQCRPADGSAVQSAGSATTYSCCDEKTKPDSKLDEQASQNLRAQKANAMNRMRLSIKDTLFKSVSRKVNPEAESEANSATVPSKDDQNSIIQQIRARTSTECVSTINSSIRNSADGYTPIQLSYPRQPSYHPQQNSWEKIVEQVEDTAPLQYKNPSRLFEGSYEILVGGKLGEGCHGEVHRCQRKNDGKIFAVKMIRNGDTEIILSAISSFKIAQTLHHETIIRPVELFVNRETEKISYVMEYCEYPSLQSFIESLWGSSPKHKKQLQARRQKVIRQYSKETHVTEPITITRSTKKAMSFNTNLSIDDTSRSNSSSSSSDQKTSIQINEPQTRITSLEIEQIKQILREILKGVKYLHSEGICHRDLKPDNILISKDLKKVKIIDLEISKRFKFHRSNKQVLKVCEMWTRTGTQDFMGPEMFESTGYTEAVDVWAVGVIAYLLLTGRPPFDQEYVSDKVEFIREAKYNKEYIVPLDELSKDFIRRMLKKEPKERLTAVEALAHPWFLVSQRNVTRKVSGISGSHISQDSSSSLMNNGICDKRGEAVDDIAAGRHFTEMLKLKQNQSTIISRRSLDKSTFPVSSFEEGDNEMKEGETPFFHFTFREEIDLSQGLVSSAGKSSQDRRKEERNTAVADDEEIDLNNQAATRSYEGSTKASDSCLQKDKQASFLEIVKKFKETMSDGMSDLRFIHINQKQQRSHAQVSQLRLRLMQENIERERHKSMRIVSPAMVDETQRDQNIGADRNEGTLSNIEQTGEAEIGESGEIISFPRLRSQTIKLKAPQKKKQSDDLGNGEIEDNIETRAKRMSEDFTAASCGNKDKSNKSVIEKILSKAIEKNQIDCLEFDHIKEDQQEKIRGNLNYKQKSQIDFIVLKEEGMSEEETDIRPNTTS